MVFLEPVVVQQLSVGENFEIVATTIGVVETALPDQLWAGRVVLIAIK